MNRVAVVYKSKYGTTEKYAKWIADSVHGDLFKHRDVSMGNLIAYDTLVYLGGLYAGGILGFSLIRKNFEKLAGKKLIVAAVGATAKKAAAVEEVKEKNMPLEMIKAGVPFFLLRGGLNYKKMHLLDRALMHFLIRSIKKKKLEDWDDDAKGMVATYGKTVDFTNKKAIAPIVSAIQG